MAKLSISLLGPLHVTLDGESVTGFQYDKVRALLIYLAVEAGRPHRRESLIGLLWPDLPEGSARTNLRQVLTILRRAIEADAADPPYLFVNRDSLQFNLASDCWLDVNSFAALLEACERHPHRHAVSCRACAVRLRQAVQLYQGPFLAGFFLPDSAAFEEWALIKREWLQRQMGETLGWLTAFYERQGDYEQALAFARRQLDLDPWREAVHRQVMRLLLLKGERTAALAQYERCRALLAAELGVEPEAGTVALYERIRDDEAGALLDQETLGLPAERPHMLPPQPTPFVGREQELEQINQLFNRDEIRLISLVGVGGSGKTRLALQAAIEQLDTYQDGVYFVSLASASSSEQLPGLIGGAVGCDLSGAERQDQQLLACLAGKELLLILDNFEHLVEGAGLLVDICAAAPDVTVTVTSRERLNLPGEWVFFVSGMALPDLPGSDAPSLEQVEATDAIRLFLQSAVRARSGYQLTLENWQSVVRICRLVSGMPLAIELAAAWVRVLPAEEIAQEIEKNLDFLSSSQRGIPERQRSLIAVFNHSWSLLSPEERAVARQLSVFEGGFTRPAAEAVAEASLHLLASLVDKSIIQRSPAGRYEIHDLLRQYAREKLAEAGEIEAARSRHSEYYCDLAERAARKEAHVYQKVWLHQLEAEHDNLRAALDWSLPKQSGTPGSYVGARLAVALYRFWYWRSYYQEGSHWLQQVLAQAPDIPPALHAEAAYAAGVLASEQDDYASARDHLHKSLQLRRQLGDKRGIAFSLNSLGLLAWSEQAYLQAFALLEESLALRRELGEKGSLAKPLNSLGLVALAQGDLEKAQAYFLESLDLVRSEMDGMGIATTISNLAAVELDLGHPVKAQNLFREGLALFHEMGDQEGVAGCLEGIGATCIAQNQFDRGGQLCGAAAALRERVHAPLTPAEEMRYTTALSLARQQVGDQRLDEALASGRSLTLQQAVALALETV